eukprot:199536_1
MSRCSTKLGHVRKVWNGNSFLDQNSKLKAILKYKCGKLNPKVGDYIDIKPTCFHPDCGWRCGEILNIQYAKFKIQVKYVFGSKIYTSWFNNQNAEIPSEWFDIYADKKCQDSHDDTHDDTNDNESKTIIMDNGSETIKIGYNSAIAAESKKFSAIIATPKKYMESNISNDIYLGDQGNRYKSLLQGTNIIHRGNVTDWDLMEKLWKYAFECKLGLIDISTYNLVLTETLLRNQSDRYKCVQLMFETFDINSLCLQNDATLSLYGVGKSTGCVISSGFGVTYSCAIYEGFVIPNSVIKVNSAGYDLTQYLKVLLSHKYANELMNIKHSVIKDIKENYCYVRVNDINYKKCEYKLPDGSIIVIEDESYKCCEKLFGGFVGLSQDGFTVGNKNVFADNMNFGIQNMLYETRKSMAKFDDISDAFKYTVLSGGSTVYKGLNDRLVKEMKKLDTDVIMIDGKDKQYLSWTGASMMGSNSEMIKGFITKNDYLEQGPRIVDIKYP